MPGLVEAGLVAAGWVTAGTTAATVASYAITFTALGAYGEHERKRLSARARKAAADAARDRLITIRSSIEPQQMILGRDRTGGHMSFFGSVGQYREKFAVVVTYAAHECYRFVGHYLNDEKITIDNDGWVTGGTFSLTIPKDATLTVSTSGGDVTIPHDVIDGTVWHSVSTPHTDNGVSSERLVVASRPTPTSAIVTVPSTMPGNNSYLSYQYNKKVPLVRIFEHMGSTTQLADAEMMALFPQEWTANHRLRGKCYAVYLFDYDQDVFTSGPPGLSAEIEGALCRDPTDINAAPTWTDNPARLIDFYVQHPAGGRKASSFVNLARLQAASARCATGADFVVDGKTTNMPLYAAGLTVNSSMAPRDVLTRLCGTMNGQWTVENDELLIWAATNVLVPVINLTDADFVGGEVSLTRATTREEAYNSIDATFPDPSNGYRTVPLPRVESSSYIAADGERISESIALDAVQNSARAQHVLSVMLREQRVDTVLTASFNLRAMPLQTLDVFRLDSTTWGFTDALFMVKRRKRTPDGSPIIVAREITAESYSFGGTYDAPLDATAPNLPRPWIAPQPQNVTVTDLTVTLADGQVITKTRVTWNAIQDRAVSSGGDIEIQVLRLRPEQLPFTWDNGNGTFLQWLDLQGLALEWETLLAGSEGAEAGWLQYIEAGDAVRTTINGLVAGGVYLLRVRSRTATTRSVWSKLVGFIVGAVVSPAAGVRAELSPTSNVSLAATALGVVADYSLATTTLLIYVGEVLDSAWIVSRVDGPGVTSTLSGQSVAITSIDQAQDSGYVTITAEKQGYPSVERRFTVTKARAGLPGIDGSDGVNGVNGADGADGADGVVPTIRCTGTNYSAQLNGHTTHSIEVTGSATDTNWARGHRMLVINPATGAIESAATFDTYAAGTTTMVSSLNSVAAGKIIAIASQDATRCDTALRTALQQFGGMDRVQWDPERRSHVFIGMRGWLKGQAYEAHTAASNASGIISVSAPFGVTGAVANGSSGLDTSESVTPGNLFLNPDGRGKPRDIVPAVWWSGGDVRSYESAGAFPYWGDIALRFSGRDSYAGDVFPVEPGDSFYIEFESIPAGGGTSPYAFRVGLMFADDAAMSVNQAWEYLSRTGALNGRQFLKGSVPVPSGKKYAKLWAGIDQSQGGTDIYYAARLKCLRRSNTEQIAPWAVTELLTYRDELLSHSGGLVGDAAQVLSVYIPAAAVDCLMVATVTFSVESTIWGATFKDDQLVPGYAYVRLKNNSVNTQELSGQVRAASVNNPRYGATELTLAFSAGHSGQVDVTIYAGPSFDTVKVRDLILKVEVIKR